MASILSGMKQRKKAKRGSGLPKLPKNGYKNVRKCGNSYQGYTPNKTHFTRVQPTAAAAAAALANKEFTTNTPKDAASVKAGHEAQARHDRCVQSRPTIKKSSC